MSTIWRTLKVFISSTFRDLELARDRLALIFRDLERSLQERQLVVRPYDLRWRDRSLQEPIVDWCIGMIDQCQYFIGILGSRYGCRPPCGPAKTPNHARLSITEMEIRYALEKIPRERRFFCFGPVTAGSESKEDIDSIEALKQMLRQRGEKIFVYHHVPELLEIVTREFGAAIDHDFPPGQKVMPVVQSFRDALEEIVAEKVRGFVGREHYLERLRQFARSRDARNYLAIHAVAGTGKSSLSARFIEDCRCNKTPVVAHFITGTQRQVREVMASLAEQLQQLGRLDDIPADPGELKNKVVQTLQQAQPLVVILDGLDELSEEAQNLSWLPRQLPAEVRIVLTTRPVKTWEVLQTFPQLQPIELGVLEDAEIAAIIADHCRQHQLRLSVSDQELLRRQAAGNPLYLKVALEELIATGNAVGQLAQSVELLFEQILDRLGRKYGEQTITDYLGFLAAKRAGACPKELEEILGVADDMLVSLHEALRNFLILRGGLVTFFHPEFERMVKIRLGKGALRRYHSRWADYLVDKGYGYVRTVEELPYQLQWAERYEDLLRLFADLSFLESKVAANMVVELREDLESALSHPVVSVPSQGAAQIGDVRVQRDTLLLLAHALEKDTQFLRRHPQSLFQSLWNLGYWHDSPETSYHYEKPEKTDKLAILPWQSTGNKLYPLLERWRKMRASACVWLRSLRPLPLPLASSLLQIFHGHEDEVTAVCFSPDGTRLASASRDRQIRIWHVQSGALLQVMSGHEAGIEVIAFSADGMRLASGAEDNMILVWSMPGGELLHILEGHGGAVRSLSFSPDGDILASGSDDNSVRLWRVQTGKQEKVFAQFPHMITCVAFSPDGNTLACGGYDNTVGLWQVASGRQNMVLRGHEGTVYAVAFSRDGSKIATGAWDSTMRLWDARSGALLQVGKGHGKAAYSVCFNADGSEIVAGGYDGAVRVWTAKTGELRSLLKGHDGPVRSVCVSPDGAKIASASGDATIRLWDAHSGSVLPSLLGHHRIIFHLELSPDFSRVVSAAKDTSVVLWETNRGFVLHSLREHGRAVYTACFSPDGRKIATGANDQTVRVWDAATGKTLAMLPGFDSSPRAVCFHPDGRRLACACRKVVQIWDSEKGELLQTFKGHDGAVSCLCFSPDGTKLASGDREHGVMLWDVATAAVLHIWKEHGDEVIRLCFSADGRQLLSGARDNTVRVWEVESGQNLHVSSHNTDVAAVAGGFNYYAGVQDNETVVRTRDGEPVAFFPAAMDKIVISPQGLIAGYVGSHVYLLKLCVNAM